VSFGNSWATRSGATSGDYGSTLVDESDAEELADIIARTPDLDKLFHGDGLPAGAGERDSTTGPGISTTLQSSYGVINESGSDLSHMPASVGSMRDLQQQAAAAGAGLTSASPSTSLHRQPSLSSAMSPPGASCSRSHRDSSGGGGDGGYYSDEWPNSGMSVGPKYSALLEELTNPVGRYRRMWLLIVFIFVMYNAVTIPFALAFRAIWSDLHVIVVLGVLFYVGDLIFMLDVVLYFFTPYTRDGLYERNLPDIRRHYLRSWFLIDFISSAPLDLLFIPFGLRYVLLARMTRFIRFIRLEGAFAIWEKVRRAHTQEEKAGESSRALTGWVLTCIVRCLSRISFSSPVQYSTKAPQVVRFMKLMMGVVLILHWLSCFWWYCGLANGLGTTEWLPPASFATAGVHSQYIVSLFWAANIVTSVGGDPGLPETDFERLADVVVRFIAVFVVVPPP